MKVAKFVVPIAVALFFITAFLLTGLSLKKYIDQVPVIEYEENITLPTDTEVPLNQLANIHAKNTKYFVKAEVTNITSSDSNNNASILNYGNGIYTGEVPSTLTVTIDAIGENGESVSKDVTVKVI